MSRVVATQAPAPFDPAYFDTVFVVPKPPLRWPDSFAIVTAHNPGGKLAATHANDQQERALRDFLIAQGLEVFTVVGASPDLTHHEAGCGFDGGTLERVAGISERFGQVAFFWVEAGDVYICIDASGIGWKVGRWQDRVLPANASD